MLGDRDNRWQAKRPAGPAPMITTVFFSVGGVTAAVGGVGAFAFSSASFVSLRTSNLPLCDFTTSHPLSAASEDGRDTSST